MAENENESTPRPARGKAQARDRWFLAQRGAPLDTPPVTAITVKEQVARYVKSAKHQLLRLFRVAPPTLDATGGTRRRRAIVEEFRARVAARASQPSDETPAVHADEDTESSQEDPSWQALGPSVVKHSQGPTQPDISGRVTALAVLNTAAAVYAASANGGVWRSEDAGVTWQSLMQNFDLNKELYDADSLACGAIGVVGGASRDTDRIFVGSGEAPMGAGTYFGVGPIISTDGGRTWQTESADASSDSLEGTGFYALAVDPSNSDRVVAATRRGLYRREPAATGFHWVRKHTKGVRATSVVAAKGVDAKGSPFTTYYAAYWGGGVVTSADGDAWTSIDTGFPQKEVGRVGLAVRPEDPAVVYALIERSTKNVSETFGVWRYDQARAAWIQVTGHPSQVLGKQGWYDLAIAIDPNSPNVLYLGGASFESNDAKLANSPDRYCASLYRCAIKSSGSGGGTKYSMTANHIGNAIHADIHALVFTPGDSRNLWVGSDGGVFHSSTADAGDAFSSRNSGLFTLSMNHLAIFSDDDAAIFGCTQDNGGLLYDGGSDLAWRHSAWGDSGFAVISWNAPDRILATYTGFSVNRSESRGKRHDYKRVSVPQRTGDNAEFYAPLVGVPYNAAVPSEADRVAFGSRCAWISDTFGGNWQSIPDDADTDFLGAKDDTVQALKFASYDKLYAGTLSGQVFRFTEAKGLWTVERLTSAKPAKTTPHPPPEIITDIAVDPDDSSGDSVYVTVGGFVDFRHVWRYDGKAAAWESRSGSAPGAGALMNVHTSAIEIDPANPQHVYVGADIGVWRSRDGGKTWAPFAEGLPDAAVIDIVFQERSRRLILSTHGRGVFSRRIA